MADVAGPAVLLRRRPYGDADLILVLLTRDRGKRTFLARSARRSVRRFGGCLESFSLIRIATGRGRGGLDTLRETSLENAFPALRTDVRRMALASFWAETADRWLEPDAPQPELFDLFRSALTHLDAGRIPAERVHLIFQLRFLALAGLAPDLRRCRGCRRRIGDEPVRPDVSAGGFRCGACAGPGGREAVLPPAVLPRLRRIADPRRESPGPAARTDRTDPAADAPAAELLERFISHHLGRTPRSLAFLRDLRNAPAPAPPTERRASHAGSSA